MSSSSEEFSTRKKSSALSMTELINSGTELAAIDEHEAQERLAKIIDKAQNEQSEMTDNQKQVLSLENLKDFTDFVKEEVSVCFEIMFVRCFIN